MRRIQAYRDPARWRGIIRRGMNLDLSWRRSAGLYIDLYHQAIDAHNGEA